MSNMKNYLLRNIPEKLHRELKAEAALEGLSVNAYIMQIIKNNIDKKEARKA